MEPDWSRRVFTLSGAAALLSSSCASMEQDAQAVLLRADRFMGGAGLRMREEYARNRAEATGGGAAPLMGLGDQRAIALVRRNFAWSMAGTAATAAPSRCRIGPAICGSRRRAR